MNKQQDLTYLYILEEELTEIETSKYNGAILRSKVQWHFESDKNTAFFLTFEKSKQEPNSIKGFNTRKGLSRKTEDNLDCAYDLYSKLYTREDIKKHMIKIYLSKK